jgi:hypothetical protein
MERMVMQWVKAVTQTELVDGIIFSNALNNMSRLTVLFAMDEI